MIKNLLFALSALCLYACTPKEYSIDGKVDGKELNVKTIFIKERINREWIVLDSTVIENGKFSFKGVADTAGIAYLTFVFPADNSIRQAFVLENGKVKAVIDTTGFIVINGTSQNDLLQIYQDQKNVFNKKYEAFYRSTKDSLKTANQKLAISKEEELLNAEEVGIDKKFATQHVNTVVGNHVFMNSFYGWTTAEKEAFIALMNTETKNIQRIQEIIADVDVEKEVAVGKTYIDFKLPALNADSLSLSDLVGKTDYVLVDFWASWCGPCMRSLPELKTLYDKYKGSRLEVLGVSLDEDREAWITVISNRQLDWKHVSDLKGWKNIGSRTYAVNSIPSTVLIDKSGKIVGRNLNINQIEKLLKKKVVEK